MQRENRMCLNPSDCVIVRRDGREEIMSLPCRVCRVCEQNRLNDFVGRSLAELAYSDRAYFVTLTYAPRDDLADKVLTPAHFQRFIRNLRQRPHNYTCRYLAAGEYGGQRGRAHFHAVLFFTGDNLPDWKAQRFAHLSAWPHGHMEIDPDVSERTLRYLCKYMLKDKRKRDGVPPAWYSMSKKPPLGAAFFQSKAAELVASGVLPQSFTYLPPSGKQTRQYYMTGATRRDYVLAVAKGFRASRPDDEARDRMNEWLQATLDKADRWELERADPELLEFMEQRRDELTFRRIDAQQSKAEREFDERSSPYYVPNWSDIEDF